jgi:hypothetical protein
MLPVPYTYLKHWEMYSQEIEICCAGPIRPYTCSLCLFFSPSLVYFPNKKKEFSLIYLLPWMFKSVFIYCIVVHHIFSLKFILRPLVKPLSPPGRLLKLILFRKNIVSSITFYYLLFFLTWLAFKVGLFRSEWRETLFQLLPVLTTWTPVMSRKKITVHLS